MPTQLAQLTKPVVAAFVPASEALQASNAQVLSSIASSASRAIAASASSAIALLNIPPALAQLVSIATAKFLYSIDSCNIVLGMGNTSSLDLARVKLIMESDVIPRTHLITVGLDVVDSQRVLSSQAPQHIPLNFDFNNWANWLLLLKALKRKVRLFTVDVSTTKFIQWTWDQLKTFSTLVGESGVMYYPIEVLQTMPYKPMSTSFYVNDEILYAEQTLKHVWVKHISLILDGTRVCVFQIRDNDRNLHNYSLVYPESVIRVYAQKKVCIATNHQDLQHVRRIIGRMFDNQLTTDNSELVYRKTSHNPGDLNIYFYFNVADLIADACFKLQRAFKYVGVTNKGLLPKRGGFEQITKAWVVATNNFDEFEKSRAVYLKTINEVLPQYSYFTKLLDRSE